MPTAFVQLHNCHCVLTVFGFFPSFPKEAHLLSAVRVDANTCNSRIHSHAKLYTVLLRSNSLYDLGYRHISDVLLLLSVRGEKTQGIL